MRTRRFQKRLTEWLQTVKKERAGYPLVRTTTGLIVPWDRERIVECLLKETALAAQIVGIEPMSRDEAEHIAQAVERRILEIDLPFVSSPLIREMLNSYLLELSKKDLRYAVYRNVLTRVGMPLWDFWEITQRRGFEALENANLQPNPETLAKKLSDKVAKEAQLLLLPPKLAEAHLMGDIHIHDLEYFSTRPFCMDYDLRFFFRYGLLADGTGRRTSVARPAKYGEVAVLHAVKVLAAGQVCCSGGQGFYNFNVFLAPYLRGLNYKQVRQIAQIVLYELNEIYVSRGGQLPFTSVQLEAGIPKLWREVPIVRAGKVGPDVYGDFEEEARLFMRAMLEEMVQGDALGKPFIWPKPEVRLRRQYFKDGEAVELLRLAAQLSAKFGSTYYDNVVPAYRGGDDSVDCYQCCAFRLLENIDSELYTKKLFFEDGEHFSMGGMQVVTINLPRLAYRANGEDSRLYENLAETMGLAKEVLLHKRRLVLAQAEHGLLPFLTQRVYWNGRISPQLCDLENLSLIIGFVGMNELVQAHIGQQLHQSKDALRFGLRVLLEMEKIKEEFCQQTDLPFVIARTPAESCATRLAVLDMLHYEEKAKEVVKGNLSEWKRRLERGFTNVPIYYTNGFMLSYEAPLDLFSKIRAEEKAFPILSGGNIFHVWLGEAQPDVEALHKLNEWIATRSQVGYYSHTKDLTVCNDCRKVSALLHQACPSCGSKNVEWYSRITGYYNAVSGWNEGKKEELHRRYRVSIADAFSENKILAEWVRSARTLA